MELVIAFFCGCVVVSAILGALVLMRIERSISDLKACVERFIVLETARKI